MSLVTRCPACATTFKVVRDQLRISDGWVRCGRCSEVFDATVELHETPEAMVASAPDISPSAAADEPEPIDEIAEADFLDDEQASSVDAVPARSDPTPDAALVIGEPWPDPDVLLLGDEGRTAVRPPPAPPLSFPDIDLTLPAPPPSSAMALPDVDEGDHAQIQKALRRARIKSAKIAKAKGRDPQEQTPSGDIAPVVLAASEPELSAADSQRMPPSFDSSEAASFWRRAWVRRSLWVVAVLAALLLIAQVLYQERDLIAARQPSLRPVLATLCRVAGCEITALRQINDIKIDGASFAREKSGDGFQLSFTLRNAAAVPLAMPAVELSLLDTQERAVVRRVLMPADFGAPAVLPARAERAASMSLSLSGPEAAAMPPVAGFRVEALYP
jgi:predicted Zn finger-like uncharacterized protein